jgi:hypothetical protein
MNIPDEDLVKLDGICSAETQSLVDKAKERRGLVCEGLPEGLAKVITKIREDGERFLKLDFERIPIHKCPVCKKGGEYAKYPRNGKYHRKGQPNYNKPIYLSGIQFNGSCVRMTGYTSTGCCNECWEKYKSVFIDKLKDLKCELPKNLFDSEYRRTLWMKCGKCGWEGNELEMGLLPAVFGGEYHGQCPSCGEKNLPLGFHHIKFVRYTLIKGSTNES